MLVCVVCVYVRSYKLCTCLCTCVDQLYNICIRTVSAVAYQVILLFLLSVNILNPTCTAQQ